MEQYFAILTFRITMLCSLLHRNDVLEKEVFEFKQRRHLRDEELIAIKKRKAELLVRYVSKYTESYLQLVHFPNVVPIKVVVVVVVVALLFYVHGKHLRSCRDGQLT